jgi:hypothetical protein
MQNTFSWPKAMCRVLYLVVVVVLCWIWMQGIHELGHVLAAAATGGHVTHVVWHPTAISRTDVAPNPSPLFVCWSGPVFGAVVPWLAAWLDRGRSEWQTVLRFFAGFCLLANGAYLSIGSIDRVGDAGDLLRLGASPAQLWCVGIVFLAVGLWIWHRLGSPVQLCHLKTSAWQLGLSVLLLLVTLLIQHAWFRAETQAALGRRTELRICSLGHVRHIRFAVGTVGQFKRWIVICQD